MKQSISTKEQGLDILKALIDDIPSAVFIIDKNVVIKLFNKAFANLFINDEVNALGKYCGNAMNCSYVIEEGTDCGKTTECDKCNLRNAFVKSLTHKEVIKEKISKNYFVNGQALTRHFYYTSKPIIIDYEDMLLVIIDDITELEEKNRRLEELNKSKNEFMRIAAHDIRGPVSTIIAFADLLLEPNNDLPIKKQQEFLNYIKDSSIFTNELLSELLDFSVIESGENSLNIKLNDFNDLIEHIAETFNYIAAQKKIEVYLEKNINIPLFCFDRNKIEQVVQNLLSNAVKYSNHNTKITITVNKSGNYLIVQINDEGPGISSKDIKKLFKPFQRGSAKATGGEKSTGLGLSICKLIIDQHNGNIWVDSSEGKGSSFFFKIPIVLTC